MATTRKIRFGVAVASSQASGAEWRDLARKAEDLGYSTLLVADHMGGGMAPMVACMAALEATTTLHLGTQVIADPFRNPVVLAKEVATLDLLSGGRFEMGIGAGWPGESTTGKSDSAQTGIAWPGGKDRIDRMHETVKILRKYLTSSEPFDFEGEFHQVHGVVPGPNRPGRGTVPIMIGGAGPRIVRIAAEEADIISVAPRPAKAGPTPWGTMGFGLTWAEEISMIREAAGARYESIELSVFTASPKVTDSPGEYVTALAKNFGCSEEEAAGMPSTLYGSEDAILERLEWSREEFDITYRVIPTSEMDAFAPIVARVS